MYARRPVFGLPDKKQAVFLPRLYADTTPLAVFGDDFGDASGKGWRFAGNMTPANLAPASSAYDPTCVDATFPNRYDRMFKLLHDLALSDNFEFTLTYYGVDGDTRMPHLFLTDSSGDGTGVGPYSGYWYMSVVTAFAYSSTASNYDAVTAANRMLGGYGIAGDHGMVSRLRKVGTTITCDVSVDGGLHWVTGTNSRTDSHVHDRICIGSIYTSGATAGKLRLGRFNYRRL